VLLTMDGRLRKIVCLCGSTRFKEAFEKANMDETLAGNIVLSVGCFGHQDPSLGIADGTQVKEDLDRLHFDKIELADEVLVLNVDGYIGKSTANEVRFAVRTNKPVRFLEETDAEREWLAKEARDAV
jgi:hypothetical protein